MNPSTKNLGNLGLNPPELLVSNMFIVIKLLNISNSLS